MQHLIKKDMRKLILRRFFMTSVLILSLTAVFAHRTPSHKAEADSLRWAVVNVSCCNLRTSGNYDAGMESQALLASP